MLGTAVFDRFAPLALLQPGVLATDLTPIFLIVFLLVLSEMFDQGTCSILALLRTACWHNADDDGGVVRVVRLGHTP
jgi:hypothetical protein